MKSALRRKLGAQRALQRARPELAVDLALRAAHLRDQNGM
jgi:hypothetical protein